MPNLPCRTLSPDESLECGLIAGHPGSHSATRQWVGGKPQPRLLRVEPAWVTEGGQQEPPPDQSWLKFECICCPGYESHVRWWTKCADRLLGRAA